MASTTIKILTKKFHFPTGLRRGGSGPLFSQRLQKRAFFHSFPYLTPLFFCLTVPGSQVGVHNSYLHLLHLPPHNLSHLRMRVIL